MMEENEPSHQETDSWSSVCVCVCVCVWTSGYKLKRALLELEAR